MSEGFYGTGGLFKEYSQDTCLAAMMTCNGCKSMNPAEPDEDKGILEKIDRLVSEDIKVMHVGCMSSDRRQKRVPKNNPYL